MNEIEDVIAIIDNGIVINIVLADSESAQELLSLVYPHSQIIKVSNETGYPFIGYGLLNGKFINASPFPSWEFDADLWQWIAPKPKPTNITDNEIITWSEENLDWVRSELK